MLNKALSDLCFVGPSRTSFIVNWHGCVVRSEGRSVHHMRVKVLGWRRDGLPGNSAWNNKHNVTISKLAVRAQSVFQNQSNVSRISLLFTLVSNSRSKRNEGVSLTTFPRGLKKKPIWAVEVNPKLVDASLVAARSAISLEYAPGLSAITRIPFEAKPPATARTKVSAAALVIAYGARDASVQSSMEQSETGEHKLTWKRPGCGEGNAA
jgi:hypothetical protein